LATSFGYIECPSKEGWNASLPTNLPIYGLIFPHSHLKL
jgi:hypothetical protein